MGVWGSSTVLSMAFFLALVPVLLAPALHYVYRRYGRFAGLPAASVAAAGLYACALVAFTTFPLPQVPASFCTRRARYDYWQLDPFASLDDVAAVIASRGLVDGLLSTTTLQVVFNVVFFVPLGVFLGWRLGRGLLGTALAGLGVSLLIELTQGSALWGIYPCPYRLADVDDLIANTAGAVLGWCLALGLRRVVALGDPVPSPDLQPPTVRRRVTAMAVDLVVALVVALLAEVVLLLAGDARLSVGPLGLTPGGVRRWLESGEDLLLVGALVLVTLVVPLLRGDRATTGQWATRLAQAPVCGPPPLPVVRRVARWAVRWLPWVATAATDLWWAGPVAALLDLVVIRVRRDRRSLAGLAGRCRTVTRPAYSQALDAGRASPAATAGLRTMPG